MTHGQKIIENYGVEYVLRQLAEETAELTQAALKLVRVMRDESPVKWDDAQNHLLEEIADAKIMIDLFTTEAISTEARLTIDQIYRAKQKRMIERLIEGDT